MHRQGLADGLTRATTLLDSASRLIEAAERLSSGSALDTTAESMLSSEDPIDEEAVEELLTAAQTLVDEAAELLGKRIELEQAIGAADLALGQARTLLRSLPTNNAGAKLQRKRLFSLKSRLRALAAPGKKP